MPFPAAEDLRSAKRTVAQKNGASVMAPGFSGATPPAPFYRLFVLADLTCVRLSDGRTRIMIRQSQ